MTPHKLLSLLRSADIVEVRCDSPRFPVSDSEQCGARKRTRATERTEARVKVEGSGPEGEASGLSRIFRVTRSFHGKKVLVRRIRLPQPSTTRDACDVQIPRS